MELKEQEKPKDVLEDYLDSIFVLSKSDNTTKNYRIGINHFRNFILEKYQCSDLELILSLKDGRIDVYKILNEFIVYLVKDEKKPSSIKGWLASVKGYLRYQGIKIYTEECKQLVKMPKTPRQREEPLTKEIIVRLLRVLPIKLQASVLFACASGVRIGELVQLRISDIDFTTKPTVVKIRAEITKTKEARETYLTEEATKALKDYLLTKFNWKENEKDEKILNQIIFGRTSLNRSLKSKEQLRTNAVFVAINVLTESLRWHSRNIQDLNKLNENGRKVIHFHAFRKFFRTTVGNAVGRDYAEAVMGHHFYLDTYYNLPQEERRKMYLKAEQNLTISDYTKIEKDLNKLSEWKQEVDIALARLGIKLPKLLEKELQEVL